MTPILLQLLTLLAQSSLVSSACYTPNGTFAPNDFPCYPERPYSFCCPPGYACLSNHLCHVTPASPDWYPEINQTTHFSRYGCSDPIWRSPECPSFCRAFNGTQGEGVDWCDPSTQKYCCTYSTDGSCTCLTRYDGFEPNLIANGTTVTVMPATMTGPSIDPLAWRSSSISRTSSNSLSSTSLSSISSTSSSLTSSTSNSASTSPTDQSSGPSVAAIAAGVATPVVVVAAAVLGLFVYRHRRQSNISTGAGMYMGDYKTPSQPTK